MEISVDAAVETGRQLVDYLAEQEVDLVITDIRMPEMDGLAVAKYVAEHYPETDVIIQSGYSDFNYAREAITYGVKNYLTKPLKPEELLTAVSGILENRKMRRIEVQEQVDSLFLRQTLEYLSLTDIMKSPVLYSRFQKACGGYFDRLKYQIFLFQGRQRLTEDEAGALGERIKDMFGSENAYAFYFRQPDELIVFRFGTEEELRKERWKISLEQQLKTWEEAGNAAVFCGCSRVYRYGRQAEEAVRDCIYAINRRLLETDARIFRYQQEIAFAQLMTKEQEKALFESVYQCRFEQAASIAEWFFGQCRQKGADIYSLYSGIMQIFAIVNQAYCEREPNGDQEGDGRYLLFSFKSDLYQFRDLKSLKDYIIGILKRTCKASEEQENYNIVDEIKNYVVHNFQYDISLNELASHKYFMNPSYLSRLFKAGTGMNFSKYLIMYRMERAKELLENTAFRINEVAGYVGYNDPSYFIQTFKKHYQMTPEQFRNMDQ